MVIVKYSVKVRIRLRRHIKVEDNIDLLHIDTSAEDVSGNHDSVLEVLELSVSLDSNARLYQASLSVNLTFPLEEGLYG